MADRETMRERRKSQLLAMLWPAARLSCRTDHHRPCRSAGSRLPTLLHASNTKDHPCAICPANSPSGDLPRPAAHPIAPPSTPLKHQQPCGCPYCKRRRTPTTTACGPAPGPLPATHWSRDRWTRAPSCGRRQGTRWSSNTTWCGRAAEGGAVCRLLPALPAALLAASMDPHLCESGQPARCLWQLRIQQQGTPSLCPLPTHVGAGGPQPGCGGRERGQQRALWGSLQPGQLCDGLGYGDLRNRWVLPLCCVGCPAGRLFPFDSSRGGLGHGLRCRAGRHALGELC